MVLCRAVQCANPAHLLATNRFQEVLREELRHFEIVLLDAPPVPGLADAPLLVPTCGDVMLVVKSGKTRTSAAVEALNRLRAAGAHILGVTLTKSPEEASRYGYSYIYSYSQGSGQQEARRG